MILGNFGASEVGFFPTSSNPVSHKIFGSTRQKMEVFYKILLWHYLFLLTIGQTGGGTGGRNAYCKSNFSFFFSLEQEFSKILMPRSCGGLFLSTPSECSSYSFKKEFNVLKYSSGEVIRMSWQFYRCTKSFNVNWSLNFKRSSGCFCIGLQRQRVSSILGVQHLSTSLLQSQSVLARCLRPGKSWSSRAMYRVLYVLIL